MASVSAVTPVEGLMPKRELPPIDQISPPALIGGPWALVFVHCTETEAGDELVWRAWSPPPHGT